MQFVYVKEFKGIERCAEKIIQAFLQNKQQREDPHWYSRAYDKNNEVIFL